MFAEEEESSRQSRQRRDKESGHPCSRVRAYQVGNRVGKHRRDQSALFDVLGWNRVCRDELASVCARVVMPEVAKYHTHRPGMMA